MFVQSLARPIARANLAARTCLTSVFAIAFLTVFSSAIAMAKDAVPAIQIPLETMGYQAMPAEFLLSGSSMLTVNFVDPTHLLMTFSVRRLMKRDEVVTPDDDDRTVGAFLLELPTGKVLAQTEWRLHDRGQYLWALGSGRFLLRIKDQLTMLAPLSATSAKEPFHEYSFLRVDRRILAILVSADEDLLTIETTARPAAKNGIQVQLGADAPANDAPVQINFYRLAQQRTDQMQIAAAGVLRSRVALALPLTTSGYLEVLEGGRDRWLMNFDSHTGKVTEMPEFPTTCYPHATFVSRSEFVAFGCRGSADKQNIAGFNVNGDEMWQQNLFDTQLASGFAFAPSVGRFAIERTLTGGSLEGGAPVLGGDVSSQEVRVYQMYNGKLLLRTDCTPPIRAGQNFALSADGLQLAIVRERIVQHGASKYDDAHASKSGSVEIYALPPLTGKDQAAVKAAQVAAPVDVGTRIDLALQRGAAKAPETAGAAPKPAAIPAPVPEADASQEVDRGAPQTSAADAPQASGDNVPRKPPTLYEPGESHKPQ